MTRALAEIKTDDGIVRFDIEDGDFAQVGPERVSRRAGTLVAELDTSLEQTLASTKPAAVAVLDAFRSMGPDQVSIEFGIRLDASAGAVIAKAGIEAHFTVKLNWNPSSAGPSP